jgi:hypothetical protein
LISASRSDRLAPAIEVAPPTTVAVTSVAAINLCVMFMFVLLLGANVGFTEIYDDRWKSVRIRAQVGIHFDR